MGRSVRRAVAGWGPGRATAAVTGAAVGIGVLVSPLDRLGREGSLTAHVTQHVALADLSAPLLLIGLPPVVAAALGAALEALGRRPGRVRLLALAVTPVGAFVVWTGLTYFWVVPSVHRSAVDKGVIHTLDHVSFLVGGLLVWLIAFDPRPRRALNEAVRTGGLPWWARHIYAATTRVAMVPAAFVIWLADESAYYPDASPLPFGVSRPDDQEQAASIMIGFELLLSGLAVVLAFVFVSIHEGRERARRGQDG